MRGSPAISFNPHVKESVFEKEMGNDADPPEFCTNIPWTNNISASAQFPLHVIL